MIVRPIPESDAVHLITEPDHAQLARRIMERCAAFCTGRADNLRFAEWAVEWSGSQVVVKPDAFSGRTIPIAIEALEVANSRFPSAAALGDALRAARSVPRVVLAGEVAGVFT